MRETKKDVALLTGAALLLMLTAVSMLLVPVADRDGTATEQALSTAAGVMFWIGLIGGLALWAAANIRYHKRPAEEKLPGRPGITCFFTSRPAGAADAVFLVSLVMNLVCGFTRMNRGVFAAVWASLLIASFHMHYILNGKVYRRIAGIPEEERGRSRGKSRGGQNQNKKKKATGGTQ